MLKRLLTEELQLKTALLFWVCVLFSSYSFMMLSWIFSASSLAFSARSSSNCSNKTQSAALHCIKSKEGEKGKEN